MTATTVPLPAPYPGRRPAPARSPWLPEVGLHRKRARWALASLAAALLILLAGIGGYYLYENRTNQPAVVGPPSPTAEPSTDWLQYRNGPGHTGVAAGTGPEQTPITYWTFETGGPIDSEPAVAEISAASESRAMVH